MHFVFLNQYYPPDAAPTGVMLEAVAEELVRQGHAVTVICAEGGYAGGRGTSNIERSTSNVEGKKEREEGEKKEVISDQWAVSGGEEEKIRGASNVEGKKERERDAPSTDWGGTLQPPSASLAVIRIGATRFGRGTFLGKLADYASFYVGVIWKLLWLRPRADRVVALTTPPFLSVVARAVSKVRGGDHAHWVMDLYPDVMVAHGMLAEGSVGHRVLAGLARWGFGGKRCAAVLTLGPDMARRTSNIERRTLNIEGRGEVGEGEGEGTSNIEHRTLNVEGKKERERDAPSTDWGGTPQPLFRATSNIGRRTLKVEGREEGTADALRGAKVVWVALWGSEQSRSVGVAPTSRTGGVSPPSSLGKGTNEREHDAPSTDWRGTLQPLSPISSHALRVRRGWGEEELVVMYSGNMGLGHRFGEVLAVAEEGISDPWAVSSEEGEETLNIELRTSDVEGKKERERDAPSTDWGGTPQPPSGGTLNIELRTSDVEGKKERERDAPSMDWGGTPQSLAGIRFAFFGGGKRRGEIAAFVAAHPGAGVELHDYVPREELAGHLESADVHLVSLDPAWTGTMVPSKLQGIFAVSRPVIFIGSAESSIGQWMTESGGGWVVAAGDVAGLRAALREARDPVERKTRGDAAFGFSLIAFDKATNVRRVAEIFARAK